MNGTALKTHTVLLTEPLLADTEPPLPRRCSASWIILPAPLVTVVFGVVVVVVVGGGGCCGVTPALRQTLQTEKSLHFRLLATSSFIHGGGSDASSLRETQMERNHVWHNGLFVSHLECEDRRGVRGVRGVRSRHTQAVQTESHVLFTQLSFHYSAISDEK